MAELILYFAIGLFSYRRLLCYLQFFQQQEYYPGRFSKWIFKHLAFDKKGSIVILLWYLWPLTIPCALTFLLLAYFEKDPTKSGKISLKMTERATSIFRVAIVLMALSFLFMPLILLIQCTPLYLVMANWLLLPYELRKQKKFLNEAKVIFSKVQPYTIGITGSFGKTSTKYALAKVLQVTMGATFWPPKSFNTPMGITREIRERLEPGYKYAVIEMGAYQVGSIKRLTELTPPQAAIITGIGTCHLDRFKSVENIVKAKSELAEAVPEDGILVCNGDDAQARHIASKYKKAHTYLYGFDSSFDCYISRFTFSGKATDFTLHWKQKSYESYTPLLGKASLSNMMAAFTMGCALGADPEFVLATLGTLEPVDNRLQVKKEDGVYILHDAYNSNPQGFASALQVMHELSGKRRIVMTPGMIELGPVQYQENYNIAKTARCDIALVVGNTNQDALVKGFTECGANVIVCQTRTIAFETMAKIKQKDDIILIENDLTDIYERIKF